MGKIAFKFDAETFPDRIFEGVVETNEQGEYLVDGEVIFTPAGEEGAYTVTDAGGQYFGQRGTIAWSVEG